MIKMKIIKKLSKDVDEMEKMLNEYLQLHLQVQKIKQNLLI